MFVSLSSCDIVGGGGPPQPQPPTGMSLAPCLRGAVAESTKAPQLSDNPLVCGRATTIEQLHDAAHHTANYVNIATGCNAASTRHVTIMAYEPAPDASAH